MFLSWNQVIRAKSYVVYRHSPVKNEYIKVAVRNGRGSNYYNIPNADSKIGYKYKVIAKNKANGKGKNVCKISYPVWAVAAGNTKGNVKEIITSKVSLKGGVGKNTLLKASVKTGTGKRVLSRNIRWYSSNRRVARVGKKNGKVFFKKKGRCYIWAKAHNGKNSKKIVVTVK